MFEFFYKKNNNDRLFKDFEDEKNVNLAKCQNYVPIYSTFFSLNDKNWNSINLNNTKIIHGINSKINENSYNIQLKNGKLTKSFFKFSPIIDPIKYMYGKYKHIDNEIIINIPTIKDVNEKSSQIHERIIRKNNVSYVDSFFSYLSCKLKQEHSFLNGIDFYGSFLGIKNNFQINIYDDLEYLTESDYFYENINKLFTLDDNFHDLLSNASRKNKKTLEFDNNSVKLDNLDSDIPEFIEDIFENNNEDNNIQNDNNEKNIINLNEVNLNDKHLIFEFDLPNKHKQVNNIDISNNHSYLSSCSSECSSNSSKTSYLDIKSHDSNNNSTTKEENKSVKNLDTYNDEDKTHNSDSSDSSESCSHDSYSTMSDELINATINKIPVQVICLENMNSTLDSYMNSYDVSDTEWKGILLQIIFTLITYQKAFDFTHNDLHTNNIMFIETEERHLYYKYKNEYFKIPTFGKIWKLIDYGRAIYTFKGKQIVSDSYHKNEDAGTQYNFGEYYNPYKPVIEANKSFDLSRLGCSLFDYFFDSIDDLEKCDDDISLLISKWCCDDNGKNLLYKVNGRERYPGFKLYKMIARTVHNHTPESQLTNKLFTKMKVKRRVVNKSCLIIDIDRIPSYTQ